MSKTERDLAADGQAGALDGIFRDDEEFDDAFDAALEEAEAEPPVDAGSSSDDAAGDPDEQHAGSDGHAEDHADGDDDGHLETVERDAAADDDPAADADVHAGGAADRDADGGAEASVDVDGADEDAGMPEIVPATPDAADAPAADARDADTDVEAFVEEPLEPDEVAEEILEELRRADIDGPQVEMAPQDDTTAARRRPRRAVDYDPAPVPIPARVPRVLSRKPRVRKVTRVVRHVDPWSVFKIAIVANLVLYITLLTAGVLLWNVAHATGTVDNVERFFESFGWQTFEFNGGEIYHAAWIAGLFGVIGLTGLAVLLATLFNLITDLVGGVRFTVLEEEVVETRTSPLRRFVVRRPEPEVPVRLTDPSGAMIREAVVDDTSANERPSR